MTDSVVFVVRIWPDALPGSGFRALVRRIDREQTQTFVNPGELLRFLIQDPWTAATRPPVDAPAAGGRDPASSPDAPCRDRPAQRPEGATCRREPDGGRT
jgi:hypothetical protein